MRRTLLMCFATLLLQHVASAQVDHFEERPVPDSVRQDILGFVSAYYDALSDRDWDRFADHFWPAATIVTIWQPPGEASERVHSSTVQQFIDRAPEGPGSREIFEERMTAARVHVHGNLATVFARYHARFGDPGDIMEWDGTDSFSLMRFEGRWRIVALSFAADG